MTEKFRVYHVTGGKNWVTVSSQMVEKCEGGVMTATGAVVPPSGYMLTKEKAFVSARNKAERMKEKWREKIKRCEESIESVSHILARSMLKVEAEENEGQL